MSIINFSLDGSTSKDVACEAIDCLNSKSLTLYFSGLEGDVLSFNSFQNILSRHGQTALNLWCSVVVQRPITCVTVYTCKTPNKMLLCVRFSFFSKLRHDIILAHLFADNFQW